MTPYYEHAGITIYHGDCRDVLPTLGTRFDAAIADPPYGQTSLAWDVWPLGWLDAVAAVTPVCWCFGSLRMFMDHAAEFTDSGWRLSQDLVWEKHNGSSFHADRFRRVHEQAAHFYQGAWTDVRRCVPTTEDATARTVRRKHRPTHMGHIHAGSYRSEDGGPRLMRSVMYAKSMHGRADNETQKPDVIVRPLIDYSVAPGGLVLSPFLGAGTDMLVALDAGCRAVGMDVREEQCEHAARRLQSVLPFDPLPVSSERVLWAQ